MVWFSLVLTIDSAFPWLSMLSPVLFAGEATTFDWMSQSCTLVSTRVSESTVPVSGGVMSFYPSQDGPVPQTRFIPSVSAASTVQ